ncbi:efflux RND transporter permease subunit [Fulvivirga sediminis]|uniref:Multidrug efflux RND transporter permease subunit n=1 Tax=Fulvivirga sediminis TaxID=2803949 RepID=A0A937FAB1_9BACT|nr:multidrug efflux RND transporter permease subunit [Fulvivirga sediminis]MBL3657877.1 multidrug efflux RND transporter permease subunit [Fulvivirga sediminis]
MIANTFINRPITAIVSSIVIVLVGVLAIMNLPIGQYPDITPPVVQVSGTYTGADAQTVEQTVVTPIETQINGVPGMKYLSSTSSNDGSFSINVTFELGTNVDIAALDVQNRLSIATPMLPSEVQRTGIIVRKRNPTILMVQTLYSPNGTHDSEFLDNYSNIYIKDALSRVDGVGDVYSVGSDFGMRIWLKPDKLAQLNLSTSDITAAIQEQNVQVAAGAVGASPQSNQQTFELTVFVNGRLKTPEQFGDIIIKTNPQDGSLVYLRDVARIELGSFSYGGNRYVNGNKAGFLLIYQAPGSNALSTAEGIFKKMEELKETFPADVDYVIPFESVSVVDISIEEVLHTLVEALILVTIVVFLFLQNWRATVIPMLAVPVSIIGTFLFFIPLGFTINTLTLFGFVLAIGIVVDDAIVVVEAVQHYMDELKIDAKEATKRAMADISAPVVAIALVLAAVFVPVGFIPGITGQLYQQFAITIAISVLLSAFIALSLTPALCSLFLKPTEVTEESKGLNRIFYKFNVWFNNVTNKYGSGVHKSIKKSKLVIILLVCVFVGTYALFMNKPTGFIPQEDEGRLYISFTLPEGASISRTENVLDKVMTALDSTHTVANYAAISGLNAVSFARKSNSGTLFVSLAPWKDRTEDDEQIDAIVADLTAKFSAIKEAQVLVIKPPAVPGLGNTGGFSFIMEQQGSNDNVNQFAGNAMKFMMAANQRPEIGMAYTFFNANTPGISMDVDKKKAKKMGVSLTEIYSTLQTYLGSRYVNDFTLYNRNFRVVAQADSSYRGEQEDLDKYYVRNQRGEMLPLSTFISRKPVESAAVINHYNLYRSAEFNGNPAPGYSSGQAIQALREVAAETLPAGYNYEFSGLSLEEIQSGDSTIYIFALSIVFVFLFLAALYESWSVPFSVLLSVPVGALGAILALTFLPYLTNNIYAQIGLITLIGLAAKNAILIVEFAKERVEAGMDIVEGTLEAVKLRLRPIVMTSLAFILGVLPLAFSSGAGAVSRNTIGWTVAGGMIAATVLGIFVVPVLYVVITKLAYGKKGLAKLKEGHNPDDYHKNHLH